MLTRKLAEEIVRETMMRLNRNVNIMDHSGKIIASGDSSRINQIHEGAVKVLESGEPLVISKADNGLLHGTRPGINLPIEINESILGVIGITGDPDTIAEFSDLIKMTTEMMIKQSLSFSQSEWKQRINAMVVEELVKPNPNWERINQRIHSLNISLHPPYTMAIIQIEESKIQNQQLIKKVESSIEESQCLIGFIGINKLFILTMAKQEDEVYKSFISLDKQLKPLTMKYQLAVGSPVNDIKKVSLSYHEAKLALLIGEMGEKSSIIFYSNIEPKAFIYQLDRNVKLRYLDRLFFNMPPKLIESLKIFFVCSRNVKQAAQTLYIHHNTLRYRLQKVKELTGLSPFIFQQAISLQIGIWCYERINQSLASDLLE